MRLLTRITKAWNISRLSDEQIEELSETLPAMEDSLGDGHATVLSPMTEEEIAVWEKEQDGWGPILSVLRGLGKKEYRCEKCNMAIPDNTNMFDHYEKECLYSPIIPRQRV